MNYSIDSNSIIFECVCVECLLQIEMISFSFKTMCPMHVRVQFIMKLCHHSFFYFTSRCIAHLIMKKHKTSNHKLFGPIFVSNKINSFAFIYFVVHAEAGNRYHQRTAHFFRFYIADQQFFFHNINE